MNHKDVAKEVILQCRIPENIILKRVSYDEEKRHITVIVNNQRNQNFPNVNLTEVTGSQLIDSISQGIYALLGNTIKREPGYAPLSFEKLLNRVNEHKVNFASFDLTFFRPTIIDNDYSIACHFSAPPKLNKDNMLLFIDIEGFQKQNDKEQKTIKGTSVVCIRYN